MSNSIGRGIDLLSEKLLSDLVGREEPNTSVVSGVTVHAMFSCMSFKIHNLRACWSRERVEGHTSECPVQSI